MDGKEKEERNGVEFLFERCMDQVAITATGVGKGRVPITVKIASPKSAMSKGASQCTRVTDDLHKWT